MINFFVYFSRFPVTIICFLTFMFLLKAGLGSGSHGRFGTLNGKNTMKNVMILLLILCLSLCFADQEQDADSLALEGFGYLKRTSGMSAGLARDRLLQTARGKFEKALELYNSCISAHPEKAGELDSKLTRINSQIFWCNKLTTMAYYNDVEKKSPAPKPVVPVRADGGTPSVSAPTASNGAGKPDEKPVPLKTDGTKNENNVKPEKEGSEKSIQNFLDRVMQLTERRRFVEIDMLCRKGAAGELPGVPASFAEQVEDEVKYVNVFLSSVFDRLLEAGSGEIVHYTNDRGRTIKMTVRSLDQGLLYMDVQESGSDQAIDMALPVFSMDNGFLVKNIKSATREVSAGIGAFFLLQQDAETARDYFLKATEQEGNLNLNPFLGRAEKLLSEQNADQIERQDKKLREDLSGYLKGAIDYYRRRNYDWALNNLKRILDKSDMNPEYLKPLSEECRSIVGKNLPGFARTVLEECHQCKGERIITCIQCKGKGKVRSLLGKARLITCPMCRGRKKIACPYCQKRINSSKNRKIVSDLEKILGKQQESP